jgi:hypothetical protein
VKIDVHVERLILEGLSAAERDSALIQAAVEAELGRQLTQRGIPKDLQTGSDQDRLLAPERRLSLPPDAKMLGAQIGAKIYKAINGFDQRGRSFG